MSRGSYQLDFSIRLYFKFPTTRTAAYSGIRATEHGASCRCQQPRATAPDPSDVEVHTSKIVSDSVMGSWNCPYCPMGLLWVWCVCLQVMIRLFRDAPNLTRRVVHLVGRLLILRPSCYLTTTLRCCLLSKRFRPTLTLLVNFPITPSFGSAFLHQSPRYLRYYG